MTSKNNVANLRFILRGFDLLDLYVYMLSLVVLSIVYLDLAAYYQYLTNGAFLPKYAYFAIGGAIAPLFFLRNSLLWKYVATPYVVWLMLMIILNVGHWLVLSSDGNDDLAGLTATRIQTLILVGIIGFLLIQADPKRVGQFFVVLALLLTTLQIIDYFAPGVIVPFGSDGVVVGRASSTLLNANKAAESLLILLLLGLTVLPLNWRIIFFVLISPGVILSFSRAGILVLFFIFICFFALKMFSRGATILLILILFIFSMVAVGLVEFVLSFVDVAALDNIYDRIMFFVDPDVGDHSAAERLNVAHYSLDSFFSNPILGNGSGYTLFWGVSDQGPHNQHLLFLAEYGMLGYLLFLSLFLIIYRGGSYFYLFGSNVISRVAFFVFLIFTPFTHNMLDNLYWLCAFFIFSNRLFYR